MRQLLALIAEREREIATLRLKFCSNDEELKRLRKRNITLHTPGSSGLNPEAQLNNSGLQLLTQQDTQPHKANAHGT